MSGPWITRIGGADLPDDWSAAHDVTRGEHMATLEMVEQLVAVVEAQRLSIDAMMAAITAQSAAVSHLAGLLVAAGIAHDASHG